MLRIGSRKLLTGCLAGLVFAGLSQGANPRHLPKGTPIIRVSAADKGDKSDQAPEEKQAPDGEEAETPKTVTIKATVEEPPAVTIKLGCRTGRAVPMKGCCLDHTGGGNIDVQQPTPDTLVVTMTGAAVGSCSTAGFNFDLDQAFEISADKPGVKKVKITMEGRLIGCLRSHINCFRECSTAGVNGAHAGVVCGGGEIVSASLPGHSVSCGECVSINDKVEPMCQVVIPGCYHLHQGFDIFSSNPSICPCKAGSAEFGDGCCDALWISYNEPFKGAAKKDFGFQVSIKVEADDSAAGKGKDKSGDEDEKILPPKPEKEKEKKLSRAYPSRRY